MAPAPDGDGEVLLAREAKSRDHVVDPGRPDDERGAAVDHPVPDGPRLVVPRVVREDDLAVERLAEGAQARHRQRIIVDWETERRSVERGLLKAVRIPVH